MVKRQNRVWTGKGERIAEQVLLTWQSIPAESPAWLLRGGPFHQGAPRHTLVDRQ